MNGGPREVIDIYTSALKQRTDPAIDGKSRAYLAEGRFLVLELMGYLVSSYRNLAGAGRQGTFRPKKGDEHE